MAGASITSCLLRCLPLWSALAASQMGGLLQFFCFASIVWTGFIALCLHLAFLRGNYAPPPRWLVPSMHILGWGLSAAVAGLLAGVGAYGSQLNICAFSMYGVGRYMEFPAYFVPLVLQQAYSLYVYCATRRRLAIVHSLVQDMKPWLRADPDELRIDSSTAAQEIPGSSSTRLTYLLARFILVFGYISAANLVHRVYQLLDPGHTVFALYVIQAFGSPMQGFGDAIVFAWVPGCREIALCRGVKRIG